MLNRAPTLHRLGIQALSRCWEGRAIRSIPWFVQPTMLTSTVTRWQSTSLPAEAKPGSVLMPSAYNILSPANGRPLAVPTQDMVLGAYYLTSVKEDATGAKALL